MSRLLGRRTVSVLATGVVCAGALLAAASPSAAAPGFRARGQASAGSRLAPPGTNLIVNPGAETGAVSQQGWDAVTIPGWRISQGLPTVVGYGTAGFPGRADAGTRGRGRQLFAGGAGGTAELTQQIPLRAGAGQVLPPGTRFSVAGWLGGTKTSEAELAVQFLSGAGQSLGVRRLGPVGLSGSAGH